MKRITARLTWNKTVKVGMPDEHINATSNGHRKANVFDHTRIGFHVGRKYGIVHDYDSYGHIYVAYNLDNKTDRDTFMVLYGNSQPEDLITGRKLKMN